MFLSACSENTLNLTLSPPVKNEVSNTYKQILKENGRRVVVTTPAFHREEGLKFTVNNNITAVLVPLDSDTLCFLKTIEDFVILNVGSEQYKPLWLDGAMYVNLSKWCKFELLKSDGTHQTLPPDMLLGVGSYSLEICVSHVYCGPHRNGKLFSLSLHVTKVLYEPKDGVMDVIDDILQAMEQDPSPPAAPIPTPTKVGKPKLKRVRRRIAFDEVDGPKNVSQKKTSST